MAEQGQLPHGSGGWSVNGNALSLPFPDATFDRIIASEVMEHIPDDAGAAAELSRVLKPGGTIAITVPSWFPEQVCWALTEEYHAPHVPGGHVRIYTEAKLRRRLRDAGLHPGAAHHAHALHSPYWWLKCTFGIDNTEAWPVRKYHDFLVYQIERQPKWVAGLDRALNPVLGKSLVIYTEKVGG
jgi:ubiquinone/menaquinone biosynthesis C-methylase UbiE